MGIGEWLSQNWFNLFGSAGVAGLWFGVHSLREETKGRRVANRIALTTNHRELWSECFRHPQLLRILNPSVDISKEPVTLEEEIFIGAVIQQLSTTYEAMKNGLTINPEGVRQDIKSFFPLPIPRAVWAEVKKLQNNDFAEFVDSSLG
ncbi:MAG TPA: hypothetical protein VFV23_10820 [Verrucomicrobiae bacterium]|nr:hypothetical protein [Verrucomicrobiae bacterium]